MANHFISPEKFAAECMEIIERHATEAGIPVKNLMQALLDDHGQRQMLGTELS